MAERREHGAPSALTVLEVAEGLRWTDPALGASLAEHVRRVAGDDPTVRAAADRSLIRSLAESDRHEDVVERGLPLLAEARTRGDRDDGATVLVELATAAVGLGDGPLARRLLDHLGPLPELPARLAATACAARAEACAITGDVAGEEVASADAAPMLLRVHPPDSTVVRARLALARGIARRRAGDVDGALQVLGAAVSADPAGDVDGGRRALAAAAEETELLVEAGRGDEAASRARSVLPPGPSGSHVVSAVARIRLALAVASADGVRSAMAVAEELETDGRSGEAARAWEAVSTLAEAAGDLGRALAAVRHGHGLASRARDTTERVLRTLAGVADGADPLAPAGTVAAADSTPTGSSEPWPAGRRSRRAESVEDLGAPAMPAAGPDLVLPSDSEPGSRRSRPPAAPPTGNGVGPSAPVADEPGPARESHPPTAPSPAVVPETPEPVAPASEPAAVVEAPAAAEDELPVGSTSPTEAAGPRASARDELAELLASLTRSVDSSRAAMSGLESPPPPVETGRSGDRPDPEPATGRRSRHAASPPPAPGTTSEPSRPTFDAFSTAPVRRAADPEAEPTPPVPPLPEDRFAPVVDATENSELLEPAVRTETGLLSVSSLVDPLAADPGDATRTRFGGETSTGSPPSVGDERPQTDVGTSGTSTRSRTTSAADVSGGEVPLPGQLGDSRPARGATPGSADDSLTDAGRSPLLPELPVPDADPVPDSDPRGSGSLRTTAGAATSPDDPDAAAADRSSSPAQRELPVDVPTRTVPRDDERADRPDAASRATRTEEAQEWEGPTGSDPRAVSGTGPARAARGTGNRGAVVSQTPAPDRAPTRRPADEYDEDLALTLATVLGEYHLPDVPMPPRRDRDRGRDGDRGSDRDGHRDGDRNRDRDRDHEASPNGASSGRPPAAGVAVPSARRHTSGSLAVPGDQRRAPGPQNASARRPDGRPDEARRDGSGVAGRGRPPESGARLADLLAEAMDAFRHVGPDAHDGAREPGVGSRRA